jgi:hypothetical protein
VKPAETVFVVPTYRLRDVADTIESYDEHFWSNGHSVKMMVFDDSSLANHEKYFSRLERTNTVNDLFYVGPREKEQFFSFLNKKLRDSKLEALVRNLFRPSYGGNRNFTLMYTLGAFMVSADDDMRPYALVEGSPESLGRAESSPATAVGQETVGAIADRCITEPMPGAGQAGRLSYIPRRRARPGVCG